MRLLALLSAIRFERLLEDDKTKGFGIEKHRGVLLMMRLPIGMVKEGYPYKYKCPKCGYETNSKSMIGRHRIGICSFAKGVRS